MAIPSEVQKIIGQRKILHFMIENAIIMPDDLEAYLDYTDNVDLEDEFKILKIIYMELDINDRDAIFTAFYNDVTKNIKEIKQSHD